MKLKSKFFLFLILIAISLTFVFAFNSFSDKNTLKVTFEHPFLIDNKWIPASELKVGDELFSVDGKKARIISIEDVDDEVDVYNLEVEKYSDFVVNGIVVHNSNGVKESYGEIEARLAAGSRSSDEQKIIDRANKLLDDRGLPRLKDSQQEDQLLLAHYSPIGNVDKVLRLGEAGLNKEQIKLLGDNWVFGNYAPKTGDVVSITRSSGARTEATVLMDKGDYITVSWEENGRFFTKPVLREDLTFVRSSVSDVEYNLGDRVSITRSSGARSEATISSDFGDTVKVTWYENGEGFTKTISKSDLTLVEKSEPIYTEKIRVVDPKNVILPSREIDTKLFDRVYYKGELITEITAEKFLPEERLAYAEFLLEKKLTDTQKREVLAAYKTYDPRTYDFYGAKLDVLKSFSPEEKIKLKSDFVIGVQLEAERLSASAYHGSNSGSLIGVRELDGLVSFGTMESRGIYPYTGELGLGVSSRGVNSLGGVSSVKLDGYDSLTLLKNYANLGEGWTPEIGKRNIEKLRKDLPSFEGVWAESIEKNLQIEEWRIKNWNSLSDFEKSLIREPFPIYYEIKNPKPLPIRGMGKERVIRDATLGDMVIYAPAEKFPMIRDYFKGKNIDLRPLENVGTKR